MIIDFASVLKISIEELLGEKAFKEKTSPKNARLLKRIQRIEELSPADQRAVLKFLEALLGKNGSKKNI